MRHTGCVSSLSGNKSIHRFPSKETHFFSFCQISLLLFSYAFSLRIPWVQGEQEAKGTTTLTHVILALMEVLAVSNVAAQMRGFAAFPEQALHFLLLGVKN